MYIVPQSNEPAFSLELAQELLKSDNEFPVDFDKAWVWLGYSRKDSAKRALLGCGFEEDFDLRIRVEPVTEGVLATPRHDISLTVEAFKQWGMMAGTEKGKQVRKYFLECEKKTKKNAEINDRIDEILGIAKEYETLKACVNTELPGMKGIMNSLVAQKALPSATRFFTAPEWLARNAPNLTSQQRINFYKEIAAAHRLLVDEPPVKVNTSYSYNNKHEFLFWQKLEQVIRHVPNDSVVAMCDFSNTKLTFAERSLINKRIRLGDLVKQLGFSNKIDPGVSSKIKAALKEAEANKLLKVKRDVQYITATSKIIKFVKWWLNNKQ